MGLKVAVASGNWSNPSTWNGGLLPTTEDVVASNGFTVTIDQNVNVDSITNAATAPVSAVPIMTGSTTPLGIVTVSTEDASFPGWQAFGLGVWKAPNNASPPAWVAYEFISPKVITSYTISGGLNSGAFPKDFTFEAWTGSSWTVLHTVVGNTNSNTYTSTFSNTTAYIKYRINVTAVFNQNYVSIDVFNMYAATDFMSTSTAGGTFNLNSGVTVTCTNTGDGISQVLNTACMIINTSSNVILNANVRGRDGSSVRCIRKTGTGNFTINGALRGQLSSAGGGGALEIANTGTVTVNGSVFEGPANSSTIHVGSTCTLNIIGDIISGFWNNNFTVDVAANNCQLNITGNIVVGVQEVAGWVSTVYRISGSGNTLNIVGNIDSTLGINLGSSVYKYGLFITGVNCVVMHTGNIIGTSNNVSGTNPVNITNTVYYNQVGYIKASMNFYGFYSTSASSIHLLTGPFISSPVGIQPFYVTRMHYRRTIGSYFEFGDNSTNGALPPAGSAPATRLVSPDTAVDAPIPANVRFGTTYALGSQTGTMRVPIAGAVAYGVEVDNTIGTALLSAAQVWNYLRNDINVSGSIGDRLKNCATVESTGSQIASFKSS